MLQIINPQFPKIWLLPADLTVNTDVNIRKHTPFIVSAILRA